MGTGILICGLNGAGKSTLGRALAEELRFYFIDTEDLYFPKADPLNPYATTRTHQEAEALLSREIQAHPKFVLASVKGAWSEAVTASFRAVALLSAPKEVRLQRVKDRSFLQFGKRMLPGGDLYEQEKAFFDLVRSRTEGPVKEWITSLPCPHVLLDGTRPIPENVALLKTFLQTR